MAIYSDKLFKILNGLNHAGLQEPGNCSGRGVNFECGCFIDYRLAVSENRSIDLITYRTNGCGHMIAAAELLARNLQATDIRDLPDEDDLRISDRMREHEIVSDPSRVGCYAAVAAALRSALKDHRSRKVEEFTGEAALVCTCFGVTEDRLAEVIAETDACDIESVMKACNAGSGCGSCQFLILDILAGANS